MYKIALLPGDGIGLEVTEQVIKILKKLQSEFHIVFETEKFLIGGCSIDAFGEPLTDDTLAKIKKYDAVFLGAVGGPKWDGLESAKRPEKGLLKLRKGLNAFANVRPVKMFDALVERSSLKPEIVKGLDFVILRELVSGIYFGEPRGFKKSASGEEQGFNTMIYSESEVERIAKKAFEMARKRKRVVTSVDKANVLEVSQLWRKVVERVHKQYPDVQLNHRYVDDCAMQFIRDPKQFDVVVTGNLFGDILSDEAAMLTGSIGMLPSASLGDTIGLYEPVHGSAPDIAGQDKANPLASILTLAMMLEWSFNLADLSDKLVKAVEAVLKEGYRTGDIATAGTQLVSCSKMGDLVAAKISK
ncbi:MAG TPA: 3-isopropylmalate dehydrogenase [Candidatus Omnitrophica bacterium]|nr:3-isopropylmalate dehydrogenase [Candidatus Omnitrophota bacterium]